MINLLPPEEKRILLEKRKEKLAAIWGIVFLVSLICLALILISTKYYILAETDDQKNILTQTKKESQSLGFEDLNSVVKKYNVTLNQLSSFYEKEIYLSEGLKVIESIPTPRGVYLTDFSFNKEDDGDIEVSASGTSDTRDNLIIFKKNIEDDKKIKEPVFPAADWINSKNISFSVTFEVRPN
ncbi:MAG: hypothetical protein NT155_01200 [Candidatus Staskawiczbacteria bacterium]|nr:hypothetical protein [Candidatus Staskawiczbacteria bacterium]